MRYALGVTEVILMSTERPFHWTRHKAQAMKGQTARCVAKPQGRYGNPVREGIVVGATQTASWRGWLFTVEWADNPGQLVFYAEEECGRIGKGRAAYLTVKPEQMRMEHWSS